MLISHFYLHVPVTLAGERMRVDRDTTVAQLLRVRNIKLVTGNLLDVKGKVLRPGEGKPAYVTVNKSRRPFTVAVHAGDDVDPHNGEDVTEPVLTRWVSIPPSTKIVGTGKYLVADAPGRTGVRREHYGGISKTIVDRKVVREPVAAVMMRTNTAPPKMVALTFDDGPWPKQTMAIARLLRRYEVPATFFVLGRQVAKYPEMVKRLVSGGFLIANHSYEHPNFTQLGAKSIRDQLKWTQSAVMKAARRKTYWVRPPGGNTNGDVERVIRGMGMRQMNWDLDSHDWTKPGFKAIAKTVISEIRPDYIVLMHDGGGDRSETLRALPIIIKSLRKKGYTFVTLDDLFGVSPSKSRLPVSEPATGTP